MTVSGQLMEHSPRSLNNEMMYVFMPRKHTHFVFSNVLNIVL